MQQTPVYFQEIFTPLNEVLNQKKYHPIFILVDENTHENCLPVLLPEIESDFIFEIIEIPSGEENKVIEIVANVWETMAQLEGSRNSLMINLGGGMVTDIGGFIASTFKRGIDFINIPTTLLSMVDASIGGKTGIDLGGIKNAVGTFVMPVSTFIYPEFLKTLPERELRSGLAEMFKHGLIQNKNHWETLSSIESFDASSLKDLIPDSVQIKQEVVEKDPLESGMRKILNFGHTIGHAIESEYLETDHPYLHGEAIAMGMLAESILSFENELISLEELDEIFISLVRVFGKHPIPEEIIPQLLVWMKQDKKNLKNQVSFSLLNGIGDCKYDIYLTDEQILEGILLYNKKLALL